MGQADHIRLGDLPRKRKWGQVVALIGHGAGTSQIASATISAAQRGLKLAMKDPRLVETVWLLSQLPAAAGSGDFAENLRKLGLDVTEPPGLVGLAGAFSDAIDTEMVGASGKTDFGEMAQMAAVEIISSVVGSRGPAPPLLSPSDVQLEIAKLGTGQQFGILARHFFARLTYKTMDYFLSRAFAHHVGEGKRFATTAQRREFAKALERRCVEASTTVEVLSDNWFSETNRERGPISRDDAASFVHTAMTRIIAELKRGVRSHRQRTKK